MGDGTNENPYTREDVLRLIEEKGGTAEGLDLSRKTFKDGIDLSGLNLGGIILNGAMLIKASLQEANLEIANLKQANLKYANLQKANLAYANLQKANLEYANLQKVILQGANLQEASLLDANLQKAELPDSNLQRAFLRYAKLQQADLRNTSLQGADLGNADLEGAYCSDIKLSPETELETVHWGDYILGDESLAEKSRGLIRYAVFDWAVDAAYRRLKQWYTNAGMYDIAGKFFFREMTAKRKAMKWWPNPIHRIWSKFLSLICGYGEKPYRVIVWAASVVLGLALMYFLFGAVWEWSALWNSLYFSAVSFTALGYGSWVSEPVGWMKAVSAFESFIGVFSIALFLVTFIRKMTR